MTRQFLLSCLLICLSGGLSAQIKKGFKYLKKMDYEKAFEAFQKETITTDSEIPLVFGTMKAVGGMNDRSRWLDALGKYEKASKTLKVLPMKTQQKWYKDYTLNNTTLDQAYNAVFNKALSLIEKGKDLQVFRDSLEAVVTVVPTAYKSRFNKLYIAQRDVPAPKRDRIDPAKRKPVKAAPVMRFPPLLSKLEFVDGINTKGSEYIPVLTADGKTMYFVGSGRTDNYAYEDVFISKRKDDGTWDTPQMDEFLSGGKNEAVVSLSADGNEMVLFIEGKPHLVKRNETGWDEPRPILLQKTFAWIGMASITRNGEALIFEAREQLYNDIDIYISQRKPNNEWDVPFALSSVVNTDRDERTPFLHSDFKTLYFSSNGHGGQGKMDVFKTTRLDDGWTNWSTPVNLGPSVNTDGDEYGFFIPPSGNVAYLATRLYGYSDQDIFRIPLDSTAQPEVQVVISGKLTDAAGHPLKGQLVVEDAATLKELQRVQSQPNGRYTFSVPKTAKINYYAVGDSLLSTKKTFVDASAYKGEVAEEKVEVITSKEVEKGKPIELRDLYFDFAKWDLRPASRTELKRIYDNIKSFQWAVEIGGHTDNVGSEDYNRQLSEKRAQSVRDYLVELGYPADKISFKGYGSSKPVSNNDTEDGKALNRRVEIKKKS